MTRAELRTRAISARLCRATFTASPGDVLALLDQLDAADKVIDAARPYRSQKASDVMDRISEFRKRLAEYDAIVKP